MIIAVDFDGTLYNGKETNVMLIARLKAAQRQGSTVILWTCREGPSLAEALSILAGAGFRPSLVNSNAPEVILRTGRDTRKIFADVYIDDKGVVP